MIVSNTSAQVMGPWPWRRDDTIQMAEWCTIFGGCRYAQHHYSMHKSRYISNSVCSIKFRIYNSICVISVHESEVPELKSFTLRARADRSPRDKRQPGQITMLQYKCEQFLFWFRQWHGVINTSLCSVATKFVCKYRFLLKKKRCSVYPINQLTNVY
jgi:hypothetical protein